MNNNLAEIKILIAGLLQDIESLENSEILPLYKWEDIMISLDIIRHKLNTHKYEQERLELRNLTSIIDQKYSGFSNNPDTIQDLEDVPEAAISEHEFSGNSYPESIEEDDDIIDDLNNPSEPEEILEKAEPLKVPEQKNITNKPGDLFSDESDDEIEFELFDDTADTILDAAIKAKPNWKKDYPGTRIRDINEGITFNDKIVFLNDLFYGDTDQYRLSMSRLNEFTTLNEAVEYLRMAFPEWNENSDTVYRFYMILRRKLDV